MGDEDGAFCDQCPHGVRAKTLLHPGDDLAGIVLRIGLAQRAQDDRADVGGVIGKRRPDRAVHRSLLISLSRNLDKCYVL
jgi:hypothetical protein